MLLSKPNETMVPAVASFLGSVQVQGNIMFAVAAAVSATVPLFMHDPVLPAPDRQSGLTAGAVKG